MTHYEILGVRRTASKDEIKTAYKRKALESHPDKNPGREDLFKKITESYSVLSSDAKRATYDLELDAKSSSHAHFPTKYGGTTTAAAMSKVQREQFKQEEKDMMAKIFEQDKHMMKRAKEDHGIDRNEFQNWYKNQARAFSGEDSAENIRKREERARQESLQKAEQEARRKRLNEIEEELHQQKQVERVRRQREKDEEREKEKQYESKRDDILMRLKVENENYFIRKKEIEEKWESKRDRQRERHRQLLVVEMEKFKAS